MRTERRRIHAAETGAVDAGADDLRTRRHDEAQSLVEFLRKQFPETGVRGDSAGDDDFVPAVVQFRRTIQQLREDAGISSENVPSDTSPAASASNASGANDATNAGSCR